jgi:hypothetical protein
VEPVVEWLVPVWLPALKAAGAVVLATLGVLFGDGPAGYLLTGVAAAGLAVAAARDVIARRRLAADPGGLTVVTGFAGYRRVPWPEVERVRVDVRRHLGLSTELLEVDAGDHLYLFARRELGAPCEEVAAQLTQLLAGARPQG